MIPISKFDYVKSVSL